MNWLDYSILIIIVIGVLTGAFKGLIHSFFQFTGLIISIIAAKKYYGFVSQFMIANTNIETAIHTFISQKNIMEELYLTLPTAKVLGDFTGYITVVVINCIALFTTFMAVRICIALLEALLKEVFKLPVLSTINHSGGAIFGFVESVLSLLLIFAILVPISTFGKLDFISRAIEGSILSKYFYSYNFILKWILENALNAITK